jgi:hypothetical protein
LTSFAPPPPQNGLPVIPAPNRVAPHSPSGSQVAEWSGRPPGKPVGYTRLRLPGTGRCLSRGGVPPTSPALPASPWWGRVGGSSALAASTSGPAVSRPPLAAPSLPLATPRLGLVTPGPALVVLRRALAARGALGGARSGSEAARPARQVARGGRQAGRGGLAAAQPNRVAARMRDGIPADRILPEPPMSALSPEHLTG